MKKLLFLFPVLGLISCVAPKDGADAEASKPAYRSSRFGMGVGYQEPSREITKETVTEKKTEPAPEPVKPAAPVAAAPEPEKPAAPVAAVPKPARPGPLFSFLSKKPATTAQDPKAKPAAAAPAAAPPAPAAAPPQRKPLFAFLMKKEPPKALVVELPKPKKTMQVAKDNDRPADPQKADDGGLRLPDMLTMPEKNEFESTNPSAVKPQGGGAVIARPPTDPPSRPKNKEAP